MSNLEFLESWYNKFSANLTDWTPEGIITVNLHLLKELNLLNFVKEPSHTSENLTRSFKVIETAEKITLINEQFVVWIVPENTLGVSTTYTLIALNRESGPKLEIVFATTGVYNSSIMVLKILEKYLNEIHENEEFLKKLASAAS